ncbi:MAG: P-aminobenzoate N-oxygenase AurF [Halobacteriovoraceae bacterium]|nr:P-aminobenzoate N-oxygenase AurF [Halobacteriovoraceae bacterium]
MQRELAQRLDISLKDDAKTFKRLKFNFKKNKHQDHTELLDQAGSDFKYSDCKDEFWNPEKFSLLYGTPLWDQASKSERVLLNQLYWVGYYSQIISAEIATIYFNQTAAAGLYGIEDFRLVCETLDFESMQERAHIEAFKIVSEEVEKEVFGKRIFTYPMRPYFSETMIFQNTNFFKRLWKRFQLQSYGLLSSSNAFIACQYLSVRGLRTLNGKIVQHQLSEFYEQADDKENAPIPSKISYYHFMDESYHFNSSNIIGTDLLKMLKKPTAFEKRIATMGIEGTLKDHSHFTSTVNGIFWYEPATFNAIYKVLRSRIFKLNHQDAIHMMELCFCQENQGMNESFKTHQIALESYKNYLQEIDYLNDAAKDGGKMRSTSIESHLKSNKKALNSFKRKIYA